MKTLMMLVAALALSACATMFQPSTDMSAAQITAAVKDKSATVICSTITSIYGTARLVTINLDQNSIKDGGITVDGEKGCAASITSVAPPKLPPAPTPPKSP